MKVFEHSEKFILQNNLLSIKPFESKYINKKFISFLNNPKVNKYLEVRKKKQTLVSAKKYLDSAKKRKILYCAIFDFKKKNIIGTITLRNIAKNHGLIGFMIGDTRYFGTKISKQSFNIFLCFVLDYLDYHTIKAATIKDNLSSNFNLITNGFKLFNRNKTKFLPGKNVFSFILKKKYLKFRTNYKVKFF
jgi:RimJ/RimL family protein N-acetyltransferase